MPRHRGNGCRRFRLRIARAGGKQVIVLGMDGMDPGFLERHWTHLPNLECLRKKGDFRRLGTTMPPQSPVAWSAFITGLDPGGTGILNQFGISRPPGLAGRAVF